MVLRPNQKDFALPFYKKPIFSLVEQLSFEGVRHIEITWSMHPEWISLVKELNSNFADISLGAASITTTQALESVAELDLKYLMTPKWNHTLQIQARGLKQLLVPGVCSPKEIYEAKEFGCQLIKIFPATTLGIKYINQVKDPIDSLPFVIAAGGLTVKDLNPWLQCGYGAITLGRGLVQNQTVDTQLQGWLKAKE